MARKPSPRLVKTHRVYTIAEAAECLGVHRKTVMAWINSDNLKAETARRPFLIDGAELKAFLTARRTRDKVRLGPGQCYCLPCRTARFAAERMAEFVLRTPTSGLLIALCPACDRLMHRAIRRSDLELHRAVLDVTIRPAVATLVGESGGPVTTPFEGEAATHAKAR